MPSCSFGFHAWPPASSSCKGLPHRGPWGSPLAFHSSSLSPSLLALFVCLFCQSLAVVSWTGHWKRQPVSPENKRVSPSLRSHACRPLKHLPLGKLLLYVTCCSSCDRYKAARDRQRASWLDGRGEGPAAAPSGLTGEHFIWKPLLRYSRHTMNCRYLKFKIYT